MTHIRKLVYCFAILTGPLFFTAPLLHGEELNSNEDTFSIEAKAAIKLPIVRELINCADMLALQEQMPPERHADSAIYRQFQRWLSIHETYEEHLRDYRMVFKPEGLWASLLMSEHAEAISMFQPATLHKFSGIAEQVKERETLTFMVSLLDRCYHNRGWQSFLKEHLNERQESIIWRLFQPEQNQGNNVEEILNSIEQELAEELDKYAARRASLAVLLKRRLDANVGVFPEDTVLKLLTNPVYQHHTLRWLVLSGEAVPLQMLNEIGEIAIDDSLDFGVRAAAVRAYGLLGTDRNVFEALENQLQEIPESPIHTTSSEEHMFSLSKSYFYRTFRQSKVMFDFRATPDADRAFFLVEELYSSEEFRKRGFPYVKPLAKTFYPLEFFEMTLERLENRPVEEITPFRYQTPLSRTMEELAARSMINDKLANRLKDNLKKLPERKLAPIIDSMGATGDFDRFGLAMIQCYSRYDESPLKGIIASRLRLMVKEETDVTEFFRQLRDEPTFGDYRETIDDIIHKIHEFRER